MKRSHLLFRIFAVLLFSIGFLLGAAFFMTSTWADVESVLYGFSRYGKESTSDMHCPQILTSGEAGRVSFSFENTSEYLLRPTVRFQVSSPVLFDEANFRLELEPGEGVVTEIEVGADNVVLHDFIFVKVFSFASYPIPDIEQTCGIIFLDLPWIGGTAVVVFSIVTSLVSMLAGLGLWTMGSKTIQRRALEIQRAMAFMIIAVVLGFVSTLLGWWMPGVVLSAITILLIGVVLGSAFQGRS